MSPTTAAQGIAREVAGVARERSPFVDWKRVAEWALIPLAFVLVRLAPDRPTGLIGWMVLVAAGALFASPAILASYREWVKGRAASSAEELAVEYRVRLGLTLGEAVIPIGDLLGRIALAGPHERAGLQGQLRRRVVDAAAALTRPERTRAVFFALEGRTLRTAAWAGRPDPPTAALVRGDPGGEAAYRLMDRHDRLLVPEVQNRPATDFGLGGDYATYLGVAVYAGSKSVGILTVDAPAPAILEETDVDIVAALAQMLGPGFAVG